MSRGRSSAPLDDDTRAADVACPAPLGLLDPAARVVPFAGREAETADLLAWSRERPRTQVRLVTGPGGVGKTRLAVELAARLTGAGWRCVWVVPGQPPGSVAAACRPSWFHAGRVLVVIDDAATRPDLAAILDATAAAAPGRLRVLLLARTGRTWWQRLRWSSHLFSGRPVVTTHTSLSTATTLSPADTVAAAAEAFGRRLGGPTVVPPIVPATAAVRQLDLHAAALVAVARARAGGPQDAVDPTRGLADLLDLERARWAGGGRPPGLPAGGDHAGPTRAAVDDAVAVAWLHGAEADVGVPGRLAELHVARRLAGSPDLLDACTRELSPDTAYQVAAFAARLDIDSPGVPEATTLPTELLRRVVPSLPDDPDVLGAVRALLPWQPAPGLAPVVAELARRRAGALPPSAVAQRAEALESLGRALCAAHPREALGPSAEAVRLQRELFAAQPERHRVSLASALANLGVVRRSTRPDDDGLAVEREAVELCRAAPPAEAVWTEPARANALRAISVSCVYLGRVESAEAHHSEVVTVLRRLVARDPVEFEPELAAVLANQMMLVDSGRPEEALSATREAVQILRRLAQERPDLHDGELARALSNVSHVSQALGRMEEAVRTAEEALEIRRRLARDDPQFRWELAWSLSGLGTLRSEQGLLWDAAALGREALEIRRGLTAESPVRYEEMLATALSNLGVTYSRLGRFDEALELEREAVGLRRALAAATPDRYAQQLARSLSNLGVRYSDLGRLDAAVAPTREAVATLRPLATQDRARFLPDLAHALANLGATFADLGRPDDAVGPVWEAATLYRELADRHPERYRPDLARSLSTLAGVVNRLGDGPEALRYVTEAVAIRRDLALQDDARFGEDLARSLALLDEIGHGTGAASG